MNSDRTGTSEPDMVFSSLGYRFVIELRSASLRLHERKGGRMVQIRNNHNVYVLGAGFSAEYGLPLVRDFLNAIRDAHVDSTTMNDRERKGVERVLRMRTEASAASSRVPFDPENIEELFSFATMNLSDEDYGHLPWAIAATLNFRKLVAREPKVRLQLPEGSPAPPAGWTNEPPRGTFTAPLYDVLLKLLLGKEARQNTIISFNYDTLIEEALDRLDVPYYYGLHGARVVRHESANERGTADDVKLLKMHGSVNWGYQEGRGKGFTLFGSYADLAGTQEVSYPMLIPPTWQKAPEGHVLSVWRHAVGALRSATRIFLIGYSMPATDQHFRYLLTAGLATNISLRTICVIDPCAETPTFRERLGLLLRSDLSAQGILAEPVVMKVWDAVQGDRARLERLLNRTINVQSAVRKA